MCTEVMQLLWRSCRLPTLSLNSMPSALVPPLSKFLSLCEKFPTTGSSPHPALITLYILLESPQDANFCPNILPTLASMLSSDHPLQSRKLALAVFNKFAHTWSSRMETVSGHHLDKLLPAVGDPYRFPPAPLQDQDRKRKGEVYWPGHAVVVLIEFASLELWRGRFQPSNFTSCEDILSTDEGRGSTLVSMFWTAFKKWPEFLCTPTKIITAVRCLEELGCLNTATVVIAWAWGAGAAGVMDQGGGRLIEGETLRFYQAHGIRSLAALKRCISPNVNRDEDDVYYRTCFFVLRYDVPLPIITESEVPPSPKHLRARSTPESDAPPSPFRAGYPRRPSNLTHEMAEPIPYLDGWGTDCVVSQVCRLRRLYHLFGFDPTTWEEAVGPGEADEKREAISRHSATPDPLIGWECDYP